MSPKRGEKRYTKCNGKRDGFTLMLDILRHCRNTHLSIIGIKSGTSKTLSIVRVLIKTGMVEKVGKRYIKTAKGMEYLNMADELIKDFGGQVGLVH